jgi:hypothetical protein
MQRRRVPRNESEEGFKRHKSLAIRRATLLSESSSAHSLTLEIRTLRVQHPHQDTTKHIECLNSFGFVFNCDGIDGFIVGLSTDTQHKEE